MFYRKSRMMILNRSVLLAKNEWKCSNAFANSRKINVFGTKRTPPFLSSAASFRRRWHVRRCILYARWVWCPGRILEYRIVCIV